MVSLVSRNSLIGARSSARNWPVVRWRLGIEGADRFQRVAEEIEPDRRRQSRRIKIDNAAALRIFAGLAHGAWRAEIRWPRASSASSSRFTTLPGAAEKLSAATVLSGGTRCRRQSTVVVTTRGRSAEDFARARRESAVMRRAAIAGVRRDAIIGLAVPARDVENLDALDWRSAAPRERRPSAARRAPHARRPRACPPRRARARGRGRRR